MGSTAVPTDDGKHYIINGTKLWATNGVIADVVVVMAVVPKTDEVKGGITAFICPTDLEGIEIKHRNEFMGLKGIENSVTTFTDVKIPAENIIAGVGKGLKIALNTLNTGRLSLPAICVGSTKYALRIVRQWSSERRQWGQALGKHDPVAQHIAFIAGTAFGLEAMVDVSSRLADEKKRDFRIEAAIAKLYGSEMAWQAIDTMVQVRGGRGFETAKSLAARGEKPVPAEQMLRDMRINRTFEGATEIMHLMIAREAVDKHLELAGDILLGDGGLGEKAKLAANAGKFYAKWFPSLMTGDGQKPVVLRRVRRPGQAPALRRAQLAQARPLDVLRDGPLPGQAGAEGRAPGPRRRHRRRALRDQRRVRLREHDRHGGPVARRSRSTSCATCSARRPAAAPTACSTTCGPTTTTRSTRPRRTCSRASSSGSSTTCSTPPATAR